MNENEFKFLINRITILSDRCAGLKVQNKVLHKRISELEIENRKLDIQCNELASKVTELNHELQKYRKEHETPAGVHEQVDFNQFSERVKGFGKR